MSMFEISEEELELENIYNRDWAEGEENPTNYVSENGFTEWIVCPECSKNQEAWVSLVDINDVREHECEQCNYLITADEWIYDSDE
jgi:hypothetical protein